MPKGNQKGKHLVATDLARSIWRLEGICENSVCPNTKVSPQLQGAHIFGVGAYPRLRDDLRNGLCLCSMCHRDFTDNPIKFTDWIRTTKYAQYIEALLEKNKTFEKRFWPERIAELKEIKKQVEAGKLTLDELRANHY